MTSTPTLDPQRTDEIRTFLVVEAAASVADRRLPLLTPGRRRLVVGAATAALLAGGLVAVQSVGGSAPAAIAVEVEDGWTTVRITDLDADPDAVVQQLIDAGFAAERQVFEVDRSFGDGPTEYSVYDDTGDAPAVVAMGTMAEGGEHGLVGLTVGFPAGVLPPPSAEAGTDRETVDDGSFELPASPDADAMEEIGVRFEADGAVSLRTGAEVTIVVTSER